MEKQLRVGVISSTHGIRGEVKVFPTTDDVKRFKKLKKVYLDTGKEQIPLEIEQVRFFKQFAILKFKGIDNINDIEKYKGKDILVDREDGTPLGKDEYYIADMIGMDVYTDDLEERFGKLKTLWLQEPMMSMSLILTNMARCLYRRSGSVSWVLT